MIFDRTALAIYIEDDSDISWSVSRRTVARRHDDFLPRGQLVSRRRKSTRHTHTAADSRAQRRETSEARYYWPAYT